MKRLKYVATNLVKGRRLPHVHTRGKERFPHKLRKYPTNPPSERRWKAKRQAKALWYGPKTAPQGLSCHGSANTYTLMASMLLGLTK